MFLRILREVTDEVRKAAAGFLFEARGQRLGLLDSVDTEIAEVLAQFTPGTKRPGRTPVSEQQGPNDALGPTTLDVLIVEEQPRAG